MNSAWQKLEGLQSVPTPCYVVDTDILRRNLGVLADVRRRADCEVLAALKGFAMFSVFDLVGRYLSGAAASSLDEARLARECFRAPAEVHLCAPAYSDADMAELVPLADCIVLNSFSQWRRHRGAIEAADPDIHCGLRINPEYSEVAVELYNPCAPGSRLGIRRPAFDGEDLAGISGLHFHTLCEQGAEPLARTLEVVSEKFGEFLALDQIRWVNFGGGHHITRGDYDVDLLCRLVRDFAERFAVRVYLEPGEAVALNAGVLVASVLDIVPGSPDVAILDTSAAAHMPDVLEMPYRPEVFGAGQPDERPHTYRLGGVTCLAGDVIGDYSFDKPLRVGDRVIFGDMAHYTMVKNTTFNGVRLPSIAIIDGRTGRAELVRQFGYDDYKRRLS